MRAHSTIDRTFSSEYDGKPCPTWMKTLEDKYKRLHMKIVFDNSTLRGNTRSSCASSAVSGGRRQTGKYVRLSKRLRPTSLRAPETKGGQQQTSTFKDVIIKNAFENEISERASKSENRLDELLEEKSDKISENDSLSDMEYGRKTARSDIYTKTKAKSLIHKNGDIKKSSRHIRSDTTKTVKSCPPAIKLQKGVLPESHAENVTETGRLPRNKASKLFQKMSKEAQIAINETLSEKKKDRTTMIRENSIKFNNYTNTMRTSRTDRHMYGTIPQDLTGKSRKGRTRSCDARRSISSDTSSSTSGFSYTKLPNIPDSRRDMTSRDLRKQNVLLPGVGRYQIPVAREQTFQITGAEYDIRYREVINCERRESISPPSDILDQAMMKCQEWLTKYAVFAKR